MEFKKKSLVDIWFVFRIRESDFFFLIYLWKTNGVGHIIV